MLFSVFLSWHCRCKAQVQALSRGASLSVSLKKADELLQTVREVQGESNIILQAIRQNSPREGTVLIFLCWKIKFVYCSCIYWCSSVLKIYNSVEFLGVKMTFFIAQIYFFVKKKEIFGRFLGDFSEKWGIFLCFRSFIYHKNTDFLFYEKIKK